MTKIDEDGWFPYGANILSDSIEMHDILAEEYELNAAQYGVVKDILSLANVCCWVTHPDGAYDHDDEADPRTAYMCLPAFIGYSTVHTSTVALEDMIEPSIDISHAGGAAQLISLQKLQRSVSHWIEMTRHQIAEAGAEDGAPPHSDDS